MTRANTARTDTAAARAFGSASVENVSAGNGRLTRVIRALIFVTVVANLAYLGGLLLPGAPPTALIDIWLPIACQWVPVCVFWLIAVRTGFERWEISLTAAGMTLNVLAQTFYVLAMDSSGYLPSPSLSDVGYLLCYPLIVAALVVLVRRQSRMVTRSVIFDSTLAMLGASAVLTVVLFPAFEDAVEGVAPLGGAIAAMYPLFDILLIAVVVGIFASPVLRLGPGWQYLIIGLFLFTGADIAYALLSHSGDYSAGTPLDAAWTIAIAFVVLWMNGVDRAQPEAPAAASSARKLPVPAIAVLAGLGVLLMGTQTPVPTVALVLAAAAVALSAVPVMFRQATLTRHLEGQERVVSRLTELDRSKSDIIGTVSHEMRTPLTSILGFLGLVLDDAAGPISAEARSMLQVANRNARRLENMVGNMLMMTRLESGGAAPAAIPFEIGRVLHRVAESLRPFADSRGVELLVVFEDSTFVEGDESQIERVFTNVMENAVKFTPATGSVRVEAISGSAQARRPDVRVTVADTGMGIPADELPQLFDRFFRATNARENAVSGTGLGLAIVHEIIQAHRGDISVDSTLGEGTTFRITLPVRQGAGA